MKRLSKKLHSRSGASLLMALMLLLVCMLVAASVLAAAASNVGKTRSNRVEQQKYLILSSAIRLIADEIEKAEYTGKYLIYEWTVTNVETDDEGNVISTSSEDFFYVEQQQGTFECGHLGLDAGTFSGKALIPLRKELDAIFNEQFKVPSGTNYKTGYGAVSGLELEDTPQTYTLTVTLSGFPEDTGPDAYKVFEKKLDTDTTAEVNVTVQVMLNHDTHHIALTAWLGTGALADAVDIMSAELVVKEGTSPTIGYNPVGRTAGALKPAGSTATTVDAAGAPMHWELYWIKKGAA